MFLYRAQVPFCFHLPFFLTAPYRHPFFSCAVTYDKECKVLAPQTCASSILQLRHVTAQDGFEGLDCSTEFKT